MSSEEIANHSNNNSTANDEGSTSEISGEKGNDVPKKEIDASKFYLESEQDESGGNDAAPCDVYIPNNNSNDDISVKDPCDENSDSIEVSSKKTVKVIIMEYKTPIIFASVSLLFAILIVVFSIVFKQDHSLIYGYTYYIPKWGNIIQFVVHIVGLVVLPIMNKSEKDEGANWFKMLTLSFFPIMSFWKWEHH